MKSQRSAAPKKNAADGARRSGLSPVEALRALKRVDEDRMLTPAQARTVAAVILAARRTTGVARIGLREIRRRTGVCFDSVIQGLKAARGRHLREVPGGWQVLGAPVGGALRQAERSGDRSAKRSGHRSARRSAHRSATDNKAKTDAHRGGRRKGTALSPSATRGGKKETGQGTGMVAVLAAKARLGGGGKWPLEQWAGQVEEDEAAGRYRRAELEALVASRTAITEAPWLLAGSVRRHAEVAKQAAFRERLQRIRAGGLTDARREGDERRWRVRYADEEDGLLILETIVRVDRVTLERLETMLAGQKRLTLDPAGRGPVAQSLRRRIEAIRAGCPDPDPPEVPKPEKREIRSLADLAGWQFRSYQPTLF